MPKDGEGRGTHVTELPKGEDLGGSAYLKLVVERNAYKRALMLIAESYWELSHDKIKSQRDEYKRTAIRVLERYWPEEDSSPVEMDDNF